MLRRMGALLLALIVLAGCSGCVRPDGETGALRIGVAVYKGDDTYISNMVSALQQSADAFSRENDRQIYVTVSDAQESQSTQNEQVDRFLSLDYDVLCVNLVDRTDAGSVIERARAADVPVVFFNREPVAEDLRTWDKAYYVGSDARESAQLQAQIVLALWDRDRTALDRNGDGVLQYVMLEGESRHQDAIIRTEAAVQTLRDAAVPLERVDGGIADWDRSQAAALTESILDSHRDEVELILCNNDDMALGAADAVKLLGLDFYNIVGIDGTPQGQEAVADGRLLGTVVMDFAAHGNTIFQLARTLAEGRDPVGAVSGLGDDRTVRIPMQMLLHKG